MIYGVKKVKMDSMKREAGCWKNTWEYYQGFNIYFRLLASNTQPTLTIIALAFI